MAKRKAVKKRPAARKKKATRNRPPVTTPAAENHNEADDEADEALRGLPEGYALESVPAGWLLADTSGDRGEVGYCGPWGIWKPSPVVTVADGGAFHDAASAIDYAHRDADRKIEAAENDTPIAKPDPPSRSITITLEIIDREPVGYAATQCRDGGNVQGVVNGPQWRALECVYAGLGLPRTVANRTVGSKADALRSILQSIADAIDAV